jgi:hypothetical protein
MLFKFWLRFNTKKICDALIDNKINPSYRNFSRNMQGSWDYFKFSHYYTENNLIYILAKNAAECYFTWILTDSEAANYKQHVMMQLLEGNGE